MRHFGNILGEFTAVQPYTVWQRTFDPLLTPGARKRARTRDPAFYDSDRPAFDGPGKGCDKLASSAEIDTVGQPHQLDVAARVQKPAERREP